MFKYFFGNNKEKELKINEINNKISKEDALKNWYIYLNERYFFSIENNFNPNDVIIISKLIKCDDIDIYFVIDDYVGKLLEFSDKLNIPLTGFSININENILILSTNNYIWKFDFDNKKLIITTTNSLEENKQEYPFDIYSIQLNNDENIISFEYYTDDFRSKVNKVVYCSANNIYNNSSKIISSLEEIYKNDVLDSTLFNCFKQSLYNLDFLYQENYKDKSDNFYCLCKRDNDKDNIKKAIYNNNDIKLNIYKFNDNIDINYGIFFIYNMEMEKKTIDNNLLKMFNKFDYVSYNTNFKNSNNEEILSNNYINGEVLDLGTNIKCGYYFILKNTNFILYFNFIDYINSYIDITINNNVPLILYSVSSPIKIGYQDDYFIDSNSGEYLFIYKENEKRFLSVCQNINEPLLFDLEYEIVYFSKDSYNIPNNLNYSNLINKYFLNSPEYITDYFKSLLKIKNIELKSIVKNPKEIYKLDIYNVIKLLQKDKVLLFQHILNNNKLLVLFIYNDNKFYLINYDETDNDIYSSIYYYANVEFFTENIKEFYNNLSLLAWGINKDNNNINENNLLTFLLDNKNNLYKFKNGIKINNISDLIDNNKIEPTNN